MIAYDAPATWLVRRGKRVILNLAAQAETMVNMLHSLDRDMALQSEELRLAARTFRIVMNQRRLFYGLWLLL